MLGVGLKFDGAIADVVAAGVDLNLYWDRRSDVIGSELEVPPLPLDPTQIGRLPAVGLG